MYFSKLNFNLNINLKSLFLITMVVFCAGLFVISTGVAQAETIIVQPGESIQTAIDALPAEGGIIELAAGTHEITETLYPTGTFEFYGGETMHYSILITKSNVTIQGTHDSIVRDHVYAYEGDTYDPVDCFLIPDLELIEGPDAFVENITFKNFKTASTYTGSVRSRNALILAMHVKNFTVENIYGSSWAYALVDVMSYQGHPRYSENVYIQNNYLEHCGFGVNHATNVYITDNTILGSREDYALHTDQRITNLYLTGNRVINAGVAGMLLDGTTNAVMRDNFVQGNRGCLRIDQAVSTALVENNTFIGSGMYAVRLLPQHPMHDVTIRNNLIYNNQDKGIWVNEYETAFGLSEVAITNNIIYNNGGDGVVLDSEDWGNVTVKNNIIANNGGYGINRIRGNNLFNTYNDVWGNTLGSYNGISAGAGDISVNPLFASTTSGSEDFHLKSQSGRWNGSSWVTDSQTSPCIDAGNPTSDYSNEPSPNGNRINIGAYGNTAEASKSGSTGPVLSSGWESESNLVRIGDDDRWLMKYYALSHMAYDPNGDFNVSGEHILISNREGGGDYFGYYYDSNENKWVENNNLVNGLTSYGCGWEYPAFAHNVTGDGKYTLISQCSGFHGFYWNGVQWVEDASRVNGLPDIGGKISHTFIENLTGDGKMTLLTGTEEGTFRSFYWNGAQWVEDASRVQGLPDIGRRSRVTAGFNVFGNNQWNIITTTDQDKYFRVFCWNGTQWTESTTKAAGLTTDSIELYPTLGYNLRGDGKWVLISGVGKLYTLLGFQYNSVDTSSLPSQTSVASYNPLATTARITFSYPNTWNHRVRYSTNSSMSNALWSEWFEDIDEVDVKLTRLNPNTTYYYEVYTYVPWDISYYVKSSVKSFNTLSSQNPITVNPCNSIQDAIEMLPLTGGTVNLASGVHNVNDTIVIYMDNITIQGTHSSELRINDRNKPAFVMPHEDPYPSEPWETMPVLENLTFKGFKVTSSYTGWRGDSLILAWNVKNLTVEDILDESYLANLIAINPTGGGTTAQGEDIYISNNILSRSDISSRNAENVHILGNTFFDGGIDLGRINKDVYICNNYIKRKDIYTYVIRGHGSAYNVRIDNNTVEGGLIGIYNDGLSNVTMSNNTITGAWIAGIHIEPQAPIVDIIIKNNFIYNCGGGIKTSHYHFGHWGEVSDADIINNVIYNNTGDGIQMTSEKVQLNIKNNIITNNGGYGINYIDTIEPTVISYNDVWGNTSGSYNNTSAGTGDISIDPLFTSTISGSEDFHLKSQYGRWNGSSWINDSQTSPCIDAGDPLSDYSNEPSPNGDRINIGAYGNTIYASKSSGGTPQPNHLPIGTLDGANQSQITGWAYDQNAGSNPIDVHIYIDGTNVGSAVANQSRPDLVSAGVCPDPNHGFTFSTPTDLSVGDHTVNVYAINQPEGTNPELIGSPKTFTVTSESPSNLVGYWKLDENSGNTAYDSSGNNDGTLMNSPAWVDGKIGKALRFDGTDDYVDCGNGSDTDFTNQSFTVLAWVKPADTGGGAIFNNRYEINGHNTGWFFGLFDSNNKLVFDFNSWPCSNDLTHQSDANAYTVNEWQYVGFTKTGTSGVFYVNGSQFGDAITVCETIEYDAERTYHYIGNTESWGWYNSYGIPDQYFDGSIDEVRIYNRALTAAEVLEHYNEGNVSDTTPPTGSIQINSGNQKTNSQNVSLTISASDPSGLSEMKISETNDFNSAIAETYATIKSFILSPIDGLKTVYVWFKDSIGNWNITPYSDTIILDSTGPTISNISVSNITTSTASISFATNEPTTSHIEYGTSAAYGFSSSAEASADKQTHSVNLTGLSSDTTYHFKIISRDELENESNSIDQTFKTIGNPDTIPPAKITDLSSSNITQTSADLLWTAKGDDGNNGTSANYDLRYSQSDPSGLAGQALQDWWDNSTQLTGEPIPSSSGTEEYISVGLSSNTNYYFIIKSADEVPNWSDYSNILSLKTLAVSTPPPPSGGGTVSDTTPPSQPSSFKAIPADSQITLNWKNPSDSDFVRVTILRISAESTLILTQKDAEELFKGCPLNCQNQNIEVIYEGNKQQYTDINLNNNTTYYYSIFAYDKKPNYSKILTISSKPIEGKTSIEISNGSSYPEGTLLKTPNSFKIYIIINQKKKWIPTPEVFETLGYQWTSIIQIDKNQLTLIPDYEDNLIRALNDFKVYLIVNGIKRHIPNPEIFLNYGFEWNEVKDVNQETINQYTQANLIKESKKEEIYYLCPERKIKRWLRSPEIFNSYLDNDWNNIQVISKYEMDHYPESNLIKLIGDNNVYLIENNRKRLINSVEEFDREGLDWGRVMGVGGVEWGWFE